MTDNKNEEPEDNESFDWNWMPHETSLDPFGPLRSGLLKSLERLKPSNGAYLVKVAILSVTHMMVLAERLFESHSLGHNAVPDRNRINPLNKINKKKLSLGWPAIKNKNRGKNKDHLL